MNPNVTIDGMSGRIGSDGMVDFRADDRVNVNFYKKSVLDPVQSQTHGRPFFVSKDYVRIQQPGEKDYADRPVADDESVTQRWPHHWARYQANQAQAPAGTPVEMLFPQQPEIAANLHSVAVHTVEQLAGLTSEGLSQVGMGAMQWKTQATEFLARASAGVGHHQHKRDLEERDNKIEVLERNLATLRGQIDRLLAERQGVPQSMIQQGQPMYQTAFGDTPPATVPPAASVQAPAATGVDAMSRNEMFAFLKERGIPAGLPISNDELRAKARTALAAPIEANAA